MRHLRKNIAMKNSWFQSTHPLRDATMSYCIGIYVKVISIHAPLTGCDNKYFCKRKSISPISIHAPLTGCDVVAESVQFINTNFNPRTPYGMRLSLLDGYIWVILISIHAPLTGCDAYCNCASCLIYSYFNPRTPYGMRLSYSTWHHQQW